MVESLFRQEGLSVIGEIDRKNVMTGGDDSQEQLYHRLLDSIAAAQGIDIIVSFLMESGVRMLLEELKEAINRGVRIRILTGNYLGITQPAALYLLKGGLKDGVDLRFYNEKGRSFHPKSYIFHYDDYSEIYVGSSNISRSALTSGIEWNYRFSSNTDKESYVAFYQSFMDLYDNHSIIIDDLVLNEYAKNWHRPHVLRDIEHYDYLESKDSKQTFIPRGVQIEALYALANTRIQGASKGLVCAATGIGKTALAAFDSLSYATVLFVAHRQEILEQAARTFRNIRQSDDIGFFDGNDKCIDKPVVFASVATLGNGRYLNERYFAKDRFEYIVIDEIHHGVASQYQRIVAYFKPRFMLGLTATPERMDGKSIYELCDYNVPYEISLYQAINQGVLVPFHYYGIFDDTNYTSLPRAKGRYIEKELTDAYLASDKRSQLIYKHYRKHGSQRALGFCCSKRHCDYMASWFNKRGVKSLAVYSQGEGTFVEKRDVAVKQLEAGEIEVIFCVDMFNEGVDIPDLDMVMFLRPTESPVIFLQQLGRGLRKAKGKEYLNVLDFIGNYEKAGKVRGYLGSERQSGNMAFGLGNMQLADGCMVDFDMRVIDLFEEMDRKKIKLDVKLKNEYDRIKELLGKRPMRMDLFTCMEEETYRLTMNHPAKNPFKHYLAFLQEHNELTQEEQMLKDGMACEFIHLIETTNMSKVYKMPVLMAFYNHGNMRSEITIEQVLLSWKEFFASGTNWKDFEGCDTYEQFQHISDNDHVDKIMKMPIHFLLVSGKGFFIKKEGCVLALHPEIVPMIHNDSFVRHFGDVVEYRAMSYYQLRYRKANGIDDTAKERKYK